MTARGIAEGYLAECEAENRALRAQLERQAVVVQAVRNVSKARNAYQTDAHCIETNAIEVARERYRQAFIAMDVALRALDAPESTKDSGEWRCRCGQLHPASEGVCPDPDPETSTGES